MSDADAGTGAARHDPFSLNGQSVLVTGGGGVGVGAGVCRALAAAGARVIVNDIDAAKAGAMAARLPDAVAVAADVASPSGVSRLFAAVEDHGIVLDGVVNNAGVGLHRSADQATDAEFERLMAVDVRGVWLVARAFARHVAAHGRQSGGIVNISSIHARSTMPAYALYAAAKAFVEGLTRGVAVELGARGVRCNAVAPGYVHSEQNVELIRGWTDEPDAWVQRQVRTYQAIEREIRADDCGHAVAFLLSPASAAITGQVLVVDAGLTSLAYAKDFA